MPEQNIWKYWLEDYPTAQYQAMIPAGVSPSFVDYWQRQQSRVMSSYEGALGKQALAGQPPSLGFGDYLGGKDWLKDWYKLSPGARGYNPGLSQSLSWRV